MNKLGIEYETLLKFKDCFIQNNVSDKEILPRKLEKTISNARETQVQIQLDVAVSS